MKTLSSAIQSLLAQSFGTEPVNILEVQWVEGGQYLKYADKEISSYEEQVKGKILSLSALESVVKLDQQGQTQGISVVLSDVEGDLKEIFNSYDIHGKHCKLHQWFEGVQVAESFKLYEGQISSPIKWSEGDRTLSFEVVTKLTDKEVGFSPEEGYFPYLPEEAVGVPWPLVFGTVQNVPATLLSEIPNTLTSNPVAVADPSVKERLDELIGIISDFQTLLQLYVYALAQAEYTADYGDTEGQRSAAASVALQLQSTIASISSELVRAQDERSDLLEKYQEQQGYETDTINLVDGSKFPQNTTLSFEIGNVILTGYVSGNVLHIETREVTDYPGYTGNPFGFTWKAEGSTISIQSELPIIYVLNLLPSTNLFLQAYKQVENGRVLTGVPGEYFEVKQTIVGDYTITYVEFSKPLSSFDETFSDDIYATIESTVGPNTVDIMIWLIETYTDLSYDVTTFNAVRTYIDNYPSHFALLDRKNIMTLLEEIAFQARCSIWISEGIFYLKYLSEDEASIDTITEADIDVGSLVINTTNTEEIVTKLTATWTDNLAKTSKNKVVLRHNVKKYGTLEREIDFYIYNIQELVIKSATFWLIRFANVWKSINFNTYLDKLAIETFDTVLFDFNTNYIANEDVKGTITQVSYDSNAKLISFEAWLPVRCGDMLSYNFAKPQNISVELFFPTNEEISNGYAGGNGPGTSVEGYFWE
jgi:hypothetical protein